jgi:hypothetical protein
MFEFITVSPNATKKLLYMAYRNIIVVYEDTDLVVSFIMENEARGA